MFKITKIKPLNTGIVCTANIYENDQSVGGVIIKSSGTLKEYQTVIAVGSMVRDINVGDVVLINPRRYLVKDKMSSENSVRNEFLEPKYHLEIPQAEVNGETVLTIDSGDISYVVEGEESEEPKETNIQLIVPKPTKLIY